MFHVTSSYCTEHYRNFQSFQRARVTVTVESLVVSVMIRMLLIYWMVLITFKMRSLLDIMGIPSAGAMGPAYTLSKSQCGTDKKPCSELGWSQCCTVSHPKQWTTYTYVACNFKNTLVLFQELCLSSLKLLWLPLPSHQWPPWLCPFSCPNTRQP